MLKDSTSEDRSPTCFCRIRLINFKTDFGWLKDCSPSSQYSCKGRNDSFAFPSCGFFGEFPLTTTGKGSASPQAKI